MKGNVSVGERLRVVRRKRRSACVEEFTQRDEIFVGATLSREARSLQVERLAHVVNLVELGTLTAEAERFVVGGAGGDVGPVALSHLHQPDPGKCADGFPDGGTSDAELSHQLGFRGQATADGPLVPGNPAFDLGGGRIGERQTGQRGHIETSGDLMTDATQRRKM
jgi:hypothetical protein